MRPAVAVFLLVALAGLAAVPRFDWGSSSEGRIPREGATQRMVDFRPMPVQPGTPVLQIAYLQMSHGEDDHAILDVAQVVLNEGVTQRASISFSTAQGAAQGGVSHIARAVSAPHVAVGERFGGIALSLEFEVDYHGLRGDRHVLQLVANGYESRWGAGLSSGGTASFRLGMRALEWGRATQIVNLDAGGALLLAVVDGATAASPGEFETWLGYYRAGVDADLVPDRVAISAALDAAVEQGQWHLEQNGDLGPALDAATGSFLLGDRPTFAAIRDRVRKDPTVLQRVAGQHRSTMAEHRQGRWLRQLTDLLGQRGSDLVMSDRDVPDRLGNFGMAVRALRWVDDPDSAQWFSSQAQSSMAVVALPWVLETGTLGESDLVEKEWLSVRNEALSKLPSPARLWASSPVYFALWCLAPIALGVALVFARVGRRNRLIPLVPSRKGSLFVGLALCVVSVNETPLLWLALPILWRLGVRLLRTELSFVDRVALAVALLVPTGTLLASIGAYPGFTALEGLGPMAGLFGFALIGMAIECEGWRPLRLLVAAILFGGVAYSLSVVRDFETAAFSLSIGSLALSVAFLVQVRPPAPDLERRSPLPAA